MATLNPIEWQCSECGTIYIENVETCEYGCKVAFSAEALKPSHDSAMDAIAALRDIVSAHDNGTSLGMIGAVNYARVVLQQHQ